jgi:hypothetical protein
MSFSLIKFEGKALEKLFDAACKGIGDLKKPWQIRREADAKAYELKVMERAKIDALLLSRELEQDFVDRMEYRILQKELKRQHNIEATIEQAAHMLKDNLEVDDEPVREDWANRFFGIVQDVSDADLRVLWAKILAGETSKSKSFSLRTLELLKNLSKEEAEILTKVVQFSLIVKEQAFIPDIDLINYGVPYSDLLLLDELGLLDRQYVSWEFTTSDNEAVEVVLRNGNIGIIGFMNETSNLIVLRVLPFTKIGNELLKLIEIFSNTKYLKSVRNWLIESNRDCFASSKYCDIQDINGELFHTEKIDLD